MDDIQYKNTPEALQPVVNSGRIPMRRIWGMLAIRPGIPFVLLLLGALAYRLSGSANAIKASSAWWLWFVTLTNIVCIVLYSYFGRKESLNLREMYLVNRASFKEDMRWMLLAILGIGVFAMLPGTLLAKALWNDTVYPNTLLLQALPLLAVYPLLVLMPITQGLAELPVYWGYVGIRLKAKGMNKWVVILLVGLVLSLQHMFFSFQLDWKYDLWLALKFLPFALWTGFIMDRRPTTLPYLMILHTLMDASVPVMTLLVSKGIPLF